jgi:ribosomal protein S6--L-glutamate ligase
LEEIPAEEYPLVVKPADGSSGRAVRLVPSPDRLAEVSTELAGEGMLIAQPYVHNSGVDLKVYCVGGEIFATERCSPLHPDRPVGERPVPLSAEVSGMAAEVGRVYGLDLYGVDVLLGPEGPVVVDVNDFPSFRQVPDAPARVARAIVELARTGRAVPGTAAAGTKMAGPLANALPEPVAALVPAPAQAPTPAPAQAPVPARIALTTGERG